MRSKGHHKHESSGNNKFMRRIDEHMRIRKESNIQLSKPAKS
jgi:hypothetical protein